MDVVTLAAALAAGRRNFTPARGQRIYLTGDSRTVLCSQPSGYTSNGTTYLYDDRSWLTWMQMASGYRWDYLGNSAVGGTTVEQHVATQLALAQASAATHVLHWGFINNIGATVTPDADAIIASLTTFYNGIRAVGKTLIVTTDYSQPANSFAAQIAAAAKINAFIRKYARENSNVLLWDIAALTVDPDTGYLRSTYTADGVHPNKFLCQILGRSLAALLDAVTTPKPRLIATPNNPYNIVPNGLFTGSGTPTGWQATDGAGSAVPGTMTKVSRTDNGPGYLWQAQLVATGSDTGKIVGFTNGIDVTGKIGHVVIPRCYFETGVQGGAMDWTNIDHFYAYASVSSGGSASSYALFPSSDNTQVQSAYFPRSGVMEGPPITIPTGSTAMRFWFEIATPSAAAGGGTVRIGQAEIHDVTACGY